MTAADQIRALGERLTDDHERKPFDTPREYTCDACSEPGTAVAAWVSYDGESEPWLCAECDQYARDEAAARAALPALADLIAAVETHAACACPDHDPAVCLDCGENWPCSTAAARDALVAALGVTEDVTP